MWDYLRDYYSDLIENNILLETACRIPYRLLETACRISWRLLETAGYFRDYWRHLKDCWRQQDTLETTGDSRIPWGLLETAGYLRDYWRQHDT